VEALRTLDIKDPELLDILFRAGEALGGAELIHRDTTDEKRPVRGTAISADWPPTPFDPPNWRPAPAAAPETQQPPAPHA
jgi:hypothetical protein